MKTFMVEQPNGDVIHWAYMDDEMFRVQVSRNRSAYKTRYSFTGNAQAALAYYKSINIGNGYKKRLMLSDTVIARCAS